MQSRNISNEDTEPQIAVIGLQNHFLDILTQIQIKHHLVTASMGARPLNSETEHLRCVSDIYRNSAASPSARS
jgi:hypothetical protein